VNIFPFWYLLTQFVVLKWVVAVSASGARQLVVSSPAEGRGGERTSHSDGNNEGSAE